MFNWLRRKKNIVLPFRQPRGLTWIGAPGLDHSFHLSNAALRSHMLLFGTTGQGMSNLFPFARPASPWIRSPLDRLLDTPPWTIGTDELLDASHPAVALAFFNHPGADADPGSPAFERHAHLLAAALAGRPLPESPDSIWLEKIESSAWAMERAPLVRRSIDLARALREAQAIETSCSGASARPKRARL